MQAEAKIRARAPLPAELLYAAWERLEAYPSWVRDLRRVEMVDRDVHQWRLHGPAGPLRWQAEVTVRDAPRRFAYCLTGDGVAGCRRAAIRPLDGHCEMVVEDSMVVRGRDGRRLLAWWGDPQARLRGDIGHLMARLRGQAAAVPRPVGFRWATASGTARGP